MTDATPFPTATRSPSTMPADPAAIAIAAPGGGPQLAGVLDAWARRWGTRDELVLLASSHREATHLNLAARTALHRHGRLQGPTLAAGDVELCPGDRVVAGPGGIGRPGGHGIPEGCPGDVRLVDPASGSLVIDFPTAGVVRLSRSRLEHTPLRYGYALPAPPGFGRRIGGIRLAHPARAGAEIA